MFRVWGKPQKTFLGLQTIVKHSFYLKIDAQINCVSLKNYLNLLILHFYVLKFSCLSLYFFMFKHGVYWMNKSSMSLGVSPALAAEVLWEIETLPKVLRQLMSLEIYYKWSLAVKLTV